MPRRPSSRPRRLVARAVSLLAVCGALRRAWRPFGVALAVVAAGACSARGQGMSTLDPRDHYRDPQVIALVQAAQRGDAAAVRAARAAGADPNAVGRDGVVPLLFALVARSPDGMRALLAAGANPNAPGPAELPLLGTAVTAEDPTFLTLLLDAGGDPSARDAGGESLLHAAVLQRRWDRVRLLAARGADVNARTTSGTTPAMLAATLGEWAQVAWLVEHGADPSIPQLSGGTVAYRLEQALARGVAGAARQEADRLRALLVARGVRFPAERPAQVRERLGLGGAAGAPAGARP